MVVLSMSDMLKRLGWTDGFYIPISDEVNRHLEDTVMRFTLRRANARSLYDLAKSKYEGLQKHLIFLQLESGQNQVLLNEFKRQIDAEEHQYQINKGNRERISKENRQMIKKMDEIVARQSKKKFDLTRSYTKTELMKSEADWDTEALIGWDKSLRKRDGDNELLVKFTGNDERRMKELEARRELISLEVINRRKLVEKMVAECINFEHVLEKTGKLFKNQSTEQQALVKHWQDSIVALRQRDADLQTVELEIDTSGGALLKHKYLVEEQNIFLKNEIANNTFVEEETGNLNQRNSRARRDLNEIIEYIVILNNDHMTVQRYLNNTAQQLEKERLKRKQLDLNAEQVKSQIDATLWELEKLKQKSSEVSSSSISAADRVKRLESVMDHENRLNVNLNIDISRIQGILYRSQQILRELCDNYRVIEAEVSGCQLSITLMHRKAEIERMDKEKKEAVVYELEFRIDRLNSHLEHVEGVIKDSESCEFMQNRIIELEQRYSKDKEIRSQLQNQVNRISDEMRRLTSAIAADAAAYHVLQGKLMDNKLLYEGGIKMVQSAKHRTQQRQVDENIFRLRVSQLNKSISKEDNNIYNLRRMQVDLEAAMQARKLEIEANRDIILAQRNAIAEETSRLRMDIASRGIRLDQYHSKHHIALMSLSHGEDGDSLSVTFIKVRNAQKKYELEQRGDELDSKINKMESEIVAMENTLKVVNITNQKFKSSLTSVEENDNEAHEMQQYQKLVNEGILHLRDVNQLLTKKQKQIYDLQDSCNRLFMLKDRLKDLLTNLYIESTNYREDEVEKFKKIHRTNHQINSNKQKISNYLKTKYDKDLYVRQMQNANNTALQKLMDFCDNFVDAASLIVKYIYARGLLLKSRASLSHSESIITSDSVLTPDNSASNRLSESNQCNCHVKEST